MVIPPNFCGQNDEIVGEEEEIPGLGRTRVVVQPVERDGSPTG